VCKERPVRDGKLHLGGEEKSELARRGVTRSGKKVALKRDPKKGVGPPL